MSMNAITGLLKQTFTEWTADKAQRLGAALAYYAVFSIPPLTVLVMSVVGLFYGGDVSGMIQRQLGGLLGEETARSIMQTTHQQTGSGGLLSSFVGIALLLFGASGVFGELQDALNTIWEVQPKSGRGVMGVIKDRFFSFTMVLGTLFLLLISLVLTTAVAAFGATLSAWLPGGEIAGHILELALSFGVITLVFAMIYKMVPDVHIAWNDVWLGAAATAALFTIGKFALGLYLGRGSIGAEYGAAGSVIVLLVWVYYSSQILFLGAEFTQVYANRYGSHVVPAENAEPLPTEKRAQEGLKRVS
jgi:membrane protein